MSKKKKKTKRTKLDRKAQNKADRTARDTQLQRKR